MKNYFYKLILKSFAKNVVSLPPKLRSKNPQKENKNKLSPIYNLLKSEKLAESNSEKLNVQEKLDYETILSEASKTMLMNYYKIYEDKTYRDKDMKNLTEYLQKCYMSNEINLFINYLKDAKKIIDSENVEKTEEVFKMFIDKVYSINSNKTINKTLIQVLSKISLKDLSPEEIFKKARLDHDTLIISDHRYQEESNNRPLQKSIFFSQLESSFNSTLNIRNPVTNDIDKPEQDFKDAFMMKYEYMFKEPLLLQKNSNLTNFDFSTYVYFTSMPFFYPIQDKESGKTIIKHLNNEIIIKNGINLSKSPEFKSFVEKYLLRAVLNGFNTENNDEYTENSMKNMRVEILSCYSPKSQVNDYYDMNLVNESVDFINEVFENTDEAKQQSMEKMGKYRTYYKTEVDESKEEIYNMTKFIENTRYLQLRKHEIEKEIKGRIKDPILCNGLIQFNNYEEKKIFLNSGAGTFGVHLQGKNVRFMDADFCNVLEVKHYLGDNCKNIKDLMKFINLRFKIKNENALMLEMPNYVNDISGTLSSQTLDDPDCRIYIRFNSFLNALRAYQLFKEEPLKKVIRAKISKPIIRFYNGHFFSGLELVMKNTITDLEKILSIPSNYSEINNILEKEII